MAHADESDEDVVVTKSNFNSSLIQLLKKSRLLGGTTILVGLNGAQSNSLKAVRNEGAKIVLTPTELTFHDFKAIRNIIDRFAVGSNWNTPGLFSEMRRLLEFGIAPHEVLNCVTRYGLDIFNMGSRLGSIEAGKLANLALIDTRKISARRIEKFAPEEALSALIEDYTDSDVSDVMLDGEFVYRDRKLLLYNDAELLVEENDLFETIMRSKEIAVPVSEGKNPLPKVPLTREENVAEAETDRGKVELPKNIRKVFGEDEF
jgi:cytosine/adenosine deaminase-related metal-dependent hydrolase